MRILFDESISLKCKGMYVLIKQMIESEMDISIKSISSINKDGQSSVSSAINELIDSGYLERIVVKDGNLTRGYKYKINE